MSIVIFGGRGQLGTELAKQLGNAAVAFDRTTVDITSPDSIQKCLENQRAEVVINCAAYNLVDQAEDEPEVACRVNALGPRNIALACSELGVLCVHVSTDYVFQGQGVSTPWRENDTPEPSSAYGVSKLAGEYFVRSLCPKHFVLRTCGLYGHAARDGAGKGNFVETMLRLASERDELRIIDDQFCTPTSVEDLAKAIIRLIKTDKFGLYHATNEGETTWARFAEEIFRVSNLSTKVARIPSSEYPTKARRPSYSVLNTDKLAQVIGSPMPRWEDTLKNYLLGRVAR